MAKYLISGGAGYIGSHMVYLLLSKGHEVVVIDNFSNSSVRNLVKIQEILNKEITIVNRNLIFDLNDFDLQNIDGVMHFAAYKAVGESVNNPLKYYRNNLQTTVNLLEWCLRTGVSKFIFSSTAAVYGSTENIPISEKEPTRPESPYGFSKLFAEQIIKDFCKVNPNFSAVALRYFNAAGNLDSGEIGEEAENPSNLIPALITSHLGLRDTKMKVFGNDFPTKDGSAIRDYINVLDLAEAHFQALEFMDNNKGYNFFNVGTNTGYSVLEILKTFERVCNEKVEYEIVSRRPGDPPISIADNSLIKEKLKWEPRKNLEETIKSSWLWYKDNNKKN